MNPKPLNSYSIYLLQNEAVQCVAQIHVNSLSSDYHISGNNFDLIAFLIDLYLLIRALRSASSIFAFAADDRRLPIKLVKKLPLNSTASSPFLTLETKGPFSAVVHDIPISKPLSRANLNELQAALDAAQDLPRTLVGVDATEMSISAFFMWTIGLHKKPKVTGAQLIAILPLAILHTLGNLFTHTIKALEPFFLVVLSAMFFGEVPSPWVVLSLTPIVGGVALASMTEVSFNWGGFWSAMASNLTNPSHNVLSKKNYGFIG